MRKIFGVITFFYNSILPADIERSNLTFFQYWGIGLVYLILFSSSLFLNDIFKGEQHFGFWYPAAGFRFLFLMVYGSQFALVASVVEVIAHLNFFMRFSLSEIPLAILISILIRPLIYASVIEPLKRLNALNIKFTEFNHIAWLCAAIISVSALSALTSTYLASLDMVVAEDNFWISVVKFWFGDVVGILMIAPITIPLIIKRLDINHTYTSLIETFPSIINRKFILEVLAAFFATVFLVLSTKFLFGQIRWLPLLIPAFWLAIRYGYSGASIVVSILILTLGSVMINDSNPTIHLGISFILPIMSMMVLLLGALSSSRRELKLKLDQQIIQIAHQDRLNSLGEMASILAHELVQPLCALRISIGRIKNAYSKNDAGQVFAMLNETEAATKRMEKIISKVKEFSKRGQIKKQYTTFKKVLMEIDPLLSLETQKLNLDIKYNLHDEDTLIYVDIIQIQQCILNLIRNAVASIGKVNRENHEIGISCSISSDIFEVTVCDTGIGITPEMENKLFNPYESSSDNNIGLGLPICHSIIKEHGGSISFQNNKEYGTTFYLKIPLKEVRHGK